MASMNIMPDSIMTDTHVATARHSIEEICTIAGTRIPNIPAIPPDSVPNLESIRRVYDIAFAPGLDKFLESTQHWYSKAGFDLLANDRALLGLVLAYLTLVSANHDAPTGENATLASQEARVTWGLLSLCSRPDQSDGEETTKLSRRFQVLESLLTSEPLTSTASSISEFIHQEEPEPKPEPRLKEETTKQSTFDKQVTRRTEDFWKTLESIAMAQGKGEDGDNEIRSMLEHIKGLLDGKESRDIIYSILLLSWGKNGDPSSERELAVRYLQTEAQGRATNQVCATLSGMALRAFNL